MTICYTAFANNSPKLCSKSGYTVSALNGVFTDEEGARNNQRFLKAELGDTYNGEKIDYQYLLNPSHLAGLGDLLKVAYQKLFENETVEDYDLVEMLKTASEKVKTQKVLLVAHSQGNFYANSFYDIVAGKDGGIPAESISVYSVATPASRVAGGGKWLTSDTDKVIAGIVGRTPFKKIMSPNTSIVLKEGDDFNGHSFSNIYLKYRGKEIVSDVRLSLDKLKENPNKDTQKPCIDPPKLTLAHKVAGVFLNSADLAINTGIETAVFAGKETYKAGIAVVETAKQTAAAVGNLVKSPLSLFDAKENDIANNPASVISATSIAKNIINENDSNIAVGSISNILKTEANDSIKNANNSSGQEKIALAQKELEEIKLQITELKKTEDKTKFADVVFVLDKNEKENMARVKILDAPRLVFVGMIYPGFGGGGEIAQVQTIATEQNNEIAQEITTLSPPILSGIQCSQSLASDGCLLATTTISFSWAEVSGATHYAINKNGEFATTTDLSFTANIADFSDYTFSVSAVSSATTSATSTQTISVATIPIAINEIAWMGTNASSYDEWMELKNNTKYRIDLSQWALESSDGAPFIALAGEIYPYEYRVLERRANTITASSITTVYGNGSSQWALGNGGEEMLLLRSSTTLDRTPSVSDGGWTAGDNASSTLRKTMERLSPKTSGAEASNWATWGTNVSFIKSGRDRDNGIIFGTPGECNSASYESINNGQNATNSLTLSANDCYYLASGMSISASSTLFVEEGVRISLYQNNLVVNGVIVASGTPDNPVIIDSFSGAPTDNGINISGSNGTSTMENISISNTNGIYLNNGASLEITNSEFANNDYGIELNNGSFANIENVNFASTTNESLSVYNGSSVTIASSTITNTIDGDAISVYNSALSMSSTTINYVGDGDGISAYDSTVSIASSTISNVLDGDGIGAYDSTMSIASSTVSNIYDGDGISLYNSTTTMQNVSVENVSNDGVSVYGGSVSGNAVIDGNAVNF